MTTVKAFIRTGKKDKEVNVRFRLSDGRNVQLFHKSEIMVLPNIWDAKNEQYKAKSVIKLEERTQFNASINERKNLLKSSTEQPSMPLMIKNRVSSRIITS